MPSNISILVSCCCFFRAWNTCANKMNLFIFFSPPLSGNLCEYLSNVILCRFVCKTCKWCIFSSHMQFREIAMHFPAFFFLSLLVCLSVSLFLSFNLLFSCNVISFPLTIYSTAVLIDGKCYLRKKMRKITRYFDLRANEIKWLWCNSNSSSSTF